MASETGSKGEPSGVRLIVLDAAISDADLKRLTRAIQNALKLIPPEIQSQAMSAPATLDLAEDLQDDTLNEIEGNPNIVKTGTQDLGAVSHKDRITFDPDQCGGRPCLRGLRVRVRDVLDLLAAGADRAEILADHPMLEDADITAALEYAARQSDHPVLRVA